MAAARTPQLSENVPRRFQTSCVGQCVSSAGGGPQAIGDRTCGHMLSWSACYALHKAQRWTRHQKRKQGHHVLTWLLLDAIELGCYPRAAHARRAWGDIPAKPRDARLASAASARRALRKDPVLQGNQVSDSDMITPLCSVTSRCRSGAIGEVGARLCRTVPCRHHLAGSADGSHTAPAW